MKTILCHQSCFYLQKKTFFLITLKELLSSYQFLFKYLLK